MTDTRICKTCHRDLPLTAYYTRGGLDTRLASTECKRCHGTRRFAQRVVTGK